MKHTLTLTDVEWSALAEAVRLAQQIAEESADRLNPALSRVQRKMGEEVGAQ
jgi:hypothetical protein